MGALASVHWVACGWGVGGRDGEGCREFGGLGGCLFLFWWETEEVMCQARLKGVMLGIGAKLGKRDDATSWRWW